MINIRPVSWAVLALALCCVSSCDRRRTDPPTDSTTTDSTQLARPAERAQPGNVSTPERAACEGLSGPELAQCQTRAQPSSIQPSAEKTQPSPRDEPAR